MAVLLLCPKVLPMYPVWTVLTQVEDPQKKVNPYRCGAGHTGYKAKGQQHKNEERSDV